MPVEFIGMIHTNDGSESRPQTTPLLDPDFTRRHARAHEDAGFDRVLIGYGSSWPEGTQVAAHVAAHTERLGLLIAHRPGFVFPTLAARQFATLDQFSGGRVAVHVITGGNDAEQRRDGDYLAKDERYARTDEYLEHPPAAPGPPRRRSASTAASTASRTTAPGSGRCTRPASRCSSAAPPPPPTGSAAGTRTRSRCGASRSGKPPSRSPRCGPRPPRRAARPPGSACSFRPILGATEDLAWERAHRILDAIEHPPSPGAQHRGWRGANGQPENTGSQRLLAAAARGDLHDRALWTATARASGAGGNSTALVGTPDTVAQALLDYVDLGVTTLLIRGYDPLEDATDYGRELIPLVRAEVARRDAAQTGAAEPGAEAELAGRP